MMWMTIPFLLLFFHILLALITPSGQWKYAKEISKVEGKWKLLPIFYFAHLYTKQERHFLCAFDSDAKYCTKTNAILEAYCLAALNNVTDQYGNQYIVFTPGGDIQFRASNLCNSFALTRGFASYRHPDGTFYIPPRIVMMLRKLYNEQGVQKPRKSVFDNRPNS